jgi:SAM-dependent methyltransferase
MMPNHPGTDESEEFLEALQAGFAAAGVACTPERWEHHASGVGRVSTLLSRLEGFLNCPISEARVLDLGCASGSASVAFALRGYRQVVGLDPARDALGLNLAARRARGRGLGIDLVQGDGCLLPYQSNTFNLCFCDWVIEHVATPAELIDEIHRVLVPGGIFYVATNNRLWPMEAHSGLWLTSWMPNPWAGRLATWLGRWPEGMSWDVRLLTYWQLSSYVRRAGLEVIGRRQDVITPRNRGSSMVFCAAERLRFPIEAFGRNLYLVSRKALPPKDSPNGLLPK